MKTSFRFERTVYGWNAFVRKGRAFVFFGHFYSQTEARYTWQLAQCARAALALAKGEA
jgi:hypothetical protein